jgi:hypothetical protein
MEERWKKVHNEELRNSYSSQSIIRMDKSIRMRWAERIARMGEKGNVCMLLVGKPQGRPKRRWLDSIKLDLEDVLLVGMDWIDLAQNWDNWKALVLAGMSLQVP